MPRTITETVDNNYLQIRFRVMDPTNGGTVLERAHAEIAVVYTRSDSPSTPRAETVTFKIADTGPQVEGSQKLTEALLSDGTTPATNRFSGADRDSLTQLLIQVKDLAEEILNF